LAEFPAVRSRLALTFVLAPLAVAAALVANAGGVAPTPVATASAIAVEVLEPGATRSTAATPSVASPPAAQPATTEVFQYPADGSVVSAASTTASASATVTRNAAAVAEGDATQVSIFGGAITADAVSARASAGTGPSGAGGNANRSTVVNLEVDGQPVTGLHAALGDWGQLFVGSDSIDRTAPAGTKAYHATLVELDVKLTAAHGGLPAGSEIRIGAVDVAVQTAPPETHTTSTTTAPAVTAPPLDPTAGDAPRLRPRGSATSSGPLRLHPKLTAEHYVFPVYGPTSYIDTFGAPRADVTYHHGDDIFGELGQPILACANGIVFSVGWNKLGGNRLWLVDSKGNQFYYAHLSAFSTAAENGAHVKAGQVIGFMGDTGDAEGTPYHLHFEVHPVSLLYLGYDGAVDPTPYLDAWKHQQDLPFPVAGGWVPSIAGRAGAPEPGAILLGVNDISTADGLDPASLRAAMAPVKQTALMQTLVPTPVAPTKDLGRG
jgi:murein DD-endopeptidase MepM/ murein hydrolase activator NlpD